MAKSEKTSKSVATLAAQALRNPDSITKSEIQKLAGSVLTQAPDLKEAPAKAKAVKPSGDGKKKKKKKA